MEGQIHITLKEHKGFVRLLHPIVHARKEVPVESSILYKKLPSETGQHMSSSSQHKDRHVTRNPHRCTTLVFKSV
jgi:hypothetical protein